MSLGAVRGWLGRTTGPKIALLGREELVFHRDGQMCDQRWAGRRGGKNDEPNSG